MASSMIKQALTYFFALGIAISSVNPAIAAQKKKSNGIIKKAVIAYIVIIFFWIMILILFYFHKVYSKAVVSLFVLI